MIEYILLAIFLFLCPTVFFRQYLPLPAQTTGNGGRKRSVAKTSATRSSQQYTGIPPSRALSRFEPTKVKDAEGTEKPKEELPAAEVPTKNTEESAQPQDAVPTESPATAEPAKSEPVNQTEPQPSETITTPTQVSDAVEQDAQEAQLAVEASTANAPPEVPKSADTVVQDSSPTEAPAKPAEDESKPSEQSQESKPEPTVPESETVVKPADKENMESPSEKAADNAPAENASQAPAAESPAEPVQADQSAAAAAKTDEAATASPPAKTDQSAPAPPTANKVQEPQVPSPTRVATAPSPSQSTPSQPASQPGVKSSAPPTAAGPYPKPAPTGQTPPFLQSAPSALKGSATPWANLPKTETLPKGPVQMVGSHEEAPDQIAESSEEYRKQFSERKKFFKQQLEQQDTLPIKVAPPPAAFKQQAPVVPPEPTVPVVLSQPKVPEALRLPIESEKDASPGTGVLRPTNSPYSPAAMAAAEKEAQATAPERSPVPPPVQPKQQPFGQQSDFPPGQTPYTDLTVPTPFHTPASPEAPPMWSPPQGPISVPSQSGAQMSPGVGQTLPSFEAPRKINQWAPGNAALDQPSKPVPFGQQKPPFAQQSPTIRTPSPTFNMQQQGQHPTSSIPHNQFSSPQAGIGSYTPPGYAPQPAGMLNAAPLPHMGNVPPPSSMAPLPDLTDLIGMTPMNKKKTFVDSSFYSEKHELYPTFEEQVKLCRDISSSLTSEDNKQSLGARMFTRRKMTSKKWTTDATHHGVNGEQWESGGESDMENEPPKPAGPPPLKYYMSPKGVDDAQSLMQKDPDAKIYDSISPISLAAVSQGLESSAGRGVDLFQKRKQKSEEWVVDETNVKKVAPMPAVDNSGPNKLQSLLNSQSVLYVKSPWEAALESPIGSCENAFQNVRMGDRGNANPVLTQRTPSPNVGAPAFHKPASPAPPPNDSFSRLPRGWAPPSASPAPMFEPAPAFHPPSPSPKPTPPMFKPPTPEPVPSFRPQFTPPPPTPAPVHSVYRAAPPVADFQVMNDNAAMDADIPNYQQAPQSVVRRFSQPAVELANVNYYPSSPVPQQPPWLNQPKQNFYKQPSPAGERHVSWHPQLKNVDHWSPQSTDEFRRMYNEKHSMWERPPEPVSYRSTHSRSRSQPPVHYSPGQQRGYQPSYNTYNAQPAKKWGEDMSNWRPPPQAVPGMTPSFRPQSPVSPQAKGGWGSDMNSWKPRFASQQQQQQQQSFNRPQPKPASPSRPGSWGSDMHGWTPRPQPPSPQPVRRPQQQQRPGSWGPDMHNWNARQQAPRFPSQPQPSYTPTPPWAGGGQPARPSFAPAAAGRYGAQPAPQQQQYGTLPRASPGPSQWGGGNRGSMLVSDL
ncbi:proteoglycan 4-like isoform X2 [Paramacrobiotus metropolitanus]|uniref:proteoglycan 4-like isoform X2 n=1 Tax=Paramacrobiotus metropolitanus TaxID=2943436 RepID=UPI002445B2E0|nr:proteoglycan 4-like isoform X2 [Paramacrobiotus metropolitanus]